MDDFETLLRGSAQAHGHLCAGQVIGVRMAMLGCRMIGLDEPSRMPQIKKIIVYVEIDRCATDAIGYVTGVKLGRRSLKFVDNGIMAATFVNLETAAAVRIVSTEEARDYAARFAPQVGDKRLQQVEAYKVMPDDLLFEVQRVAVEIPVQEMPRALAIQNALPQLRSDGQRQKRGADGRTDIVPALRVRHLFPPPGQCRR